MCIRTLGGNYALLQTHMYSVAANTGQMDRWTQIGTDRYTEGYSHTRWEPVLRHPTDLASSWPLQRALKRLEDNLPLPLSVPPSLPPLSLLLSSLWPLSRQPITLMALFSTPSTSFSSTIASLPPAVWVTSRNLGLTNPKRCFGRQPKLPSQIETNLTKVLNQSKKKETMSGWCCHWSYKRVACFRWI